MLNNQIMKFSSFVSCILGAGMMVTVHAQDKNTQALPNQGNPLLPGYFADPTIKKIGDTYYMYATTDGNGGGFGPSQVWTSKDFVNWAIQPMNWPNTHWYWAPDMTKGYDGRYYLYYSQPVELFGAVSDTPVGPWASLVADDKAFVPNYMIPGVITLDGQTFTDDDGKIYMFWGTWGIYPDHGCAVGLLKEDMKSFERIELIPNTIAKDYFEAPIMFKRNGIYYLLYSSGHCEDHSYRVQYVKSSVGPFGPYEYPADNPILVTNEDGTIHGPGHNGILEENGKHYIVYHRHNNPHSGGGFHRQVAADELVFDQDGNIEKVIPTHQGIGLLAKNTRPFTDLAFGKKVTASSSYSDDFTAAFAVDNNNGTLWRAANNAGEAWLQVDLLRLENIQTVLLEMEYPTYAYQYKIDVSVDGKSWTTYADKHANDKWASPILESGKTKARYVRLTIYNTQLVGLPRGLWNMKVYKEKLKQETIWSDPQPMPTVNSIQADVAGLQAHSFAEGQSLTSVKNRGSLQGSWTASSPLLVKNYQGKTAFYLDGATNLTSDFRVPQSLDGNASYTVSAWVNNPEIGRTESLLSWSRPGHDLTLANIGYGSDPARGAVQHGGWADVAYKQLPTKNTWHHIVVTFDGYMERLYVDGKLEREQNKMLFIRQSDHFVIGGQGDDFFSGYLSALEVRNEAWTAADVQRTFTKESGSGYLFALETADAAFGNIEMIPVFGTATTANSRARLTNGKIAVLDGRVSLQTPVLLAPELTAVLQGQQYTIVLDTYRDQQWKQVILVRSAGKERVLENGKEVTSAQPSDFIQADGQQVLLKGNALHAVHVYAESLDDAAIKSTYAGWLLKKEASYVKGGLAERGEAYQINGTDVFVAVANTSDLLSYAFAYSGQSSGWIKEPHYLFNRAQPGDKVEVLVKDVFGNVGQPATMTISSSTPKDRLQGKNDLDWDMDKKIAYWDGISLPTDRDSTALDIKQLPGSEWRLASKDTKWGAQGWNGPFLYEELSGDFTVEVKVADVAGLASGTRTSSESGLMIQDPASGRSYLNNTILTGWNLGNLVRNIGRDVHQELNTGAGMQYEPYLQIQKVGAYFYLRSSADGQKWNNLPGSPFVRKDLDGKTLRVGLYQVANNNQLGFGTFQQFKVWQTAR